MTFVVAIDGPAASGKGTISKQIAKHFGFSHLDTGILYRVVGRKALDNNIDFSDIDALEELALSLDNSSLNIPNLRGTDAAEAASKVAAMPAIRNALFSFQQNFAKNPKGAVLDGRDIGTVVCPNANVKIFITADITERAQRRFLELSANDPSIIYEDILTNLKDRDARDSFRKAAPLKQAEDAHLLNTTKMSIDEAVAKAVLIIENESIH